MHIVVIVILLLFGASWGSFLNVIAYRVSIKKSFLRGRSSCTHCGKTIYWYDMIPILSWIILKGRCRFCNRRLSIKYLFVEIAVGLLFVLGGLFIIDWLHFVLYVAVVSFFVILFIYDALVYVVPDVVSIPAIVAVSILNVAHTLDPIAVVLGGLVGGAWFLIQFVLSSGKWVGGGDIRLGILIGVLVGYPYVWLSLGLAYVAGSVIAVILMALKRKTLKSRLPFATILLPCAFASWLWGEAIWGWYVGLVGL